MKKSFIKILICLLLLSLILPCFTACHKHNFVVHWSADENSHYHLCDCGEKMDLGAHVWNEGVVLKRVNCTEAGIIEQTCTICANKRQVQNTNYQHDYLPNFNETTHFDYCVGCDTSINVENHSLVYRVSPETHSAFCEGCDFVINESAHDYNAITGFCKICNHNVNDIIN